MRVQWDLYMWNANSNTLELFYIKMDFSVFFFWGDFILLTKSGRITVAYDRNSSINLNAIQSFCGDTCIFITLMMQFFKLIQPTIWGASMCNIFVHHTHEHNTKFFDRKFDFLKFRQRCYWIWSLSFLELIEIKQKKKYVELEFKLVKSHIIPIKHCIS